MDTVLTPGRDLAAMTLAADARAAVRERPFLMAALRAGVVNYTAAARSLEVGGDEEAVATALRRFAADLPARATTERDVRVTMESGLGTADTGADAPLAVGGTGLVPGEGDLTAVLATGAVDPSALAWTLDRLAAAEVPVKAAGIAGDALVVAVPRRAGADAVRVVEDALAAVPEGP